MQRQKNKFSWKKYFLFIFLLFFFLWGGYEWVYQYNIAKKVDKNAGVIGFEIEKGEFPSSVAKRLAEQKIIDSEWSFLRYAKKTEAASAFQAGYHEVSANMMIPEIVEALKKAIPKTIEIVIPEGLTLSDIDTLLAKKHGFQSGDFLACVREKCDFSEFSFLPKDVDAREGYFFPATYELEKKDISVEVLAKKMLQAFEYHAQTLGLFQSSKGSLQDLLTMASIIEKEWGNESEGGIISGILWNRIENGIQMGADATVRYALSKKKDALTVNDLATTSPFNTRKVRGFPPHAISAPGRAALKAAINPSETDYFYYLHDQNGQIHYGKTLAEHNKNKEVYCGGSCE